MTQLLIGDGTGFTAATLSGDVTMANTGAVTIANTGAVAPTELKPRLLITAEILTMQLILAEDGW